MAAKTHKTLNNIEFSVRSDRFLMNKLRDSGQEYISSSGRLIKAKTQPDTFCHCPQKCRKKLVSTTWERLFTKFYKLGDQNKQNMFLQNHIIIKAVHLHNWESDRPSPANKRRVTCKYHVPELDSDTEMDDFVKRKSKDTVEVCQKAFMNIFGITEKRVRMQRERCISKLAPGHYKNSPFGKKYKMTRDLDDTSPNTSPKKIEFANGLEITPLDLSRDKKKSEEKCAEADKNGAKEKRSRECRDEPLDLSHNKTRPQSPFKIDIDKTKLYEIAEKMGFSRERVEKEMAHKYEQLVLKNLKKQQKLMQGKRKATLENELKVAVTAVPSQMEIQKRSPIEEPEESRSPLSEQVVGLQEDLTILPIQTLNNGDLTITPVLGPVSKPVENGDIMRVNYFFQNQLWKPEYIGLSSWKKLISQSYDI